MQSSASSRMRGASILGVVALLALLSVTAIAFDSTTLIESGSQVAATTCASEPIDGVKVCDGDYIKVGSAEYQNLTCAAGYDFILRMNPKDNNDAYIYYSDGTGKVTTRKSAKQCEPNDHTFLNYKDALLGTEVHNRRCTNYPVNTRPSDQWKCLVKVCFKASVQDAKLGEMLCVLYPEKAVPVGEKIAGAADEARKINTTEATTRGLFDPNATPEQKAEANARFQALNAEEQNGILNSYKNSINQELDVAKQQETTAQAQLDAYTKGCGAIVGSGASCDKSQVDRLNAELQEKRARVLDLNEKFQDVKRLEPSSTRGREEEDSGNPSPDNKSPPYTFGPPNNQPTCQGLGCYLAPYVNHPPERGVPVGYPGYGPALTSGDDAYREQLYRACQAGSSPACQEYLGRAPRGSAGISQQCGAGQGGLIGTIVSLFMRNNNNCNNAGGSGSGSNAPTPTCQITASPQNIATGGQQVTLSWQSNQAFQASLSSAGNVATNGSMTVNPQTTTTYTLNLGGYMDNRTGQQLRGQCSVQVVVGGQGGGDGAPKAEISCRPERADVGMSIAISFACRNSAASVGVGFSTGNQMSGSATPVVASPTLGSNSVTYGLTCSNQGKTDSAQCTVEINKTSIVLIANPEKVASGGQANIGWITSGMESCTVSSPTLSSFTAENAGNTSTSGVAKTPALTEDTKFVLSCTTKSGGMKSAETTVTVN